MKILKAFKFRLKPKPDQLAKMEQTVGVVRYIWNNALALQKDRHSRGGRFLGYAELCRELTAARNDPALAFLKEVHSKPEQQVLRDLIAAFKRFFARESGFPRFKKKGCHDSFRHPENVRLQGRHVWIPGIGWLRFIKSREVVGAIKNATLSKRGGHWYVSLQTEQEVDAPVHPSNSAVGIDLGVAKFAALSNGQVISPGNCFRRLESKLARQQRILARKQKFSNNWRKQKAKIAKLHAGIADARRDLQHKASTAISKSHALVVMEDLRVKGMSASAKGTIAQPGKNVRQKAGLNKSILDQGWYEFRRQLEYKQMWRGGQLVLVAPHRTSQTCACCGHVSPDNRRTQAGFECVACGHRADADINAANNILAAGRAATACGEDPLGTSMKQEPLAAA